MPKKDFLQARLAMTISFVLIGLALPGVSLSITMESSLRKGGSKSLICKG